MESSANRARSAGRDLDLAAAGRRAAALAKAGSPSPPMSGGGRDSFRRGDDNPDHLGERESGRRRVGDGDLVTTLMGRRRALITTANRLQGRAAPLAPAPRQQGQGITRHRLEQRRGAGKDKPGGSSPPRSRRFPRLREQTQEIIVAADRFIATIDRRGYRVPMSSDSGYVWGSNSGVLDTAIVLGVAYHLTHDVRHANAVIDCVDYILGRNPLAQSYVAGHGTRAMRNPHHRIWAHQKDPRLPEAPPGALAGGPNSFLQDPYIRALGMSGCPPQTCYVDNIESYSTNEVAINWNAALAWNAAFLDDLGRATRR